ncbi:MAG: 4-(cytidine 5'-diphospho)-2-C-methyl-D-erythritol kinase [Clostridia bacterium]|nr:4-(cytidine 5'-diphospho)-2-C-methyl-D-erythritol kinase [Clostridia bacterium]
MITVKAYAKVNLCLNLVGKTDGYHDIESVVVTVGVCDIIKARKRKDKEVKIRMKGFFDLPIEENNAYKAIKLFMSEFSTCGADVEIIKKIPVGGGLGGSSADAAGALMAMAKLYGVKADLKPLAERLGSDTAYQLTGGLAVMRGRGTDLEFLPASPKTHVLIAVAEGGVSTGKCYELSDKLEKIPPADIDELVEDFSSENYDNLGKNCVNALYGAAKTINPEVEVVYKKLQELSPSAVSMTGSGSAVFAIFKTEKLCVSAAKTLKKCGINAIKTYTLGKIQ